MGISPLGGSGIQGLGGFGSGTGFGIGSSPFGIGTPSFPAVGNFGLLGETMQPQQGGSLDLLPMFQ